jgi:hypothetical protein
MSRMCNDVDLVTHGHRNSSPLRLHLGADAFDCERQRFLAAFQCFLAEPGIDAKTQVAEIDTTMKLLDQFIALCGEAVDA